METHTKEQSERGTPASSSHLKFYTTQSTRDSEQVQSSTYEPMHAHSQRDQTRMARALHPKWRVRGSRKSERSTCSVSAAPLSPPACPHPRRCALDCL
eukprot:scaffold81106_cov31-Tisochrysis_lutea.AAC.1